MPRPAFLSRRPKRGELKLVLEIEEKLAEEGVRKIENKARSGGSVYATAFQAKWAVALRAMELPEGHVDKRADIGAGLLSPVAYGDFMKLFGKWLGCRQKYRTPRWRSPSGLRARTFATRSVASRGCSQRVPVASLCVGRRRH